MLKYVEDCLAQYRMDGSKSRLVECILQGANQEAEKKGDGKYLVYNGTKALVHLSRGPGGERPITIDAIKNRGGRDLGPTGGLWPWLSKIGADVLVKISSPMAFRIRPEFYEAMQALFLDDSVTQRKRSILELEGKGKELWEGIDAQEYVDRERDSWNG